MMTSESRRILATLQALPARTFPQLSNEPIRFAKVVAMFPDTGNPARQRWFIYGFFLSKLFPDTLTYQVGNRPSLLAANGRKDFRDLIVEVKLRAFHGDVYY